MKNIRHIIAAMLCFIVLVMSGIIALADEKLPKQNDIDVIKSDSYRISFQKDIMFNSPNLLDIVYTVSDNLDEIVFSIDAGDDIFTVGYYLGDEEFSWEKITKAIGKAVGELEYDIINDDRISKNNTVSLENFYLNYIVVNSDTSISNMVSTLSGVISYKRIGRVLTEKEDFEHVQNDNKSNRTITIDGSYHHLVAAGEETFTYWYNQLTGMSSMCAASASNPHLGDADNRYDSGFQWFPNEVDVNFYTDIAQNENRTKLWYRYNQSTLNNLNVDSNEALEMEVVFYNYYLIFTPYEDKGDAFQLIENGSTWCTNQPNCYRDTNAFDWGQEVSFCVGVDDTSELVANTWYYWYIDGIKGTTTNNYPNDGRFKVTAQRSYRFIGSGTWFVFAEEHEHIRSLGITASQNWVPANENAWVYAAANDDWNFNSSTDPVK